MSRQLSRACLAAAVIAVFLGWLSARPGAQNGGGTCGTDMKLLVVSADGTEADLPAIKQALDYLGTPYTVYRMTDHAGVLDASVLSSGCHAFFQGVILTTNVAVDATTLQTLATYESAFGIRQVTWYTWPTPDFGFNWSTNSGNLAVDGRLTAAGAQVFGYLNAAPSASPVPIRSAWIYLATPLDASTVPLLSDGAGNALVAVHTYSDGRENLALTFDSNQYLLHDLLLSYGIVNWVTRGLFIGDRHVYMSPQVDDMFIDNTQWLQSTACGTNVDLTGGHFRITGSDLSAIADWQHARRQTAITPDIRLTLAFNGLGTTNDYRIVGQNDTVVVGGSTTSGTEDTLTEMARILPNEFWWVSHTFDHENLDSISYVNGAAQITKNNAVASATPPGLGLTPYSLHFMVQPDVSGLQNSNFLAAAYDNGIRYLVSDTSKPGQNNPSPNIGYWATAGQPGIFVIPRRANNLFFNVTAPEDWTAEYNCLYHDFWGRDLTYSQILDNISDSQVAYLLNGELDPWMFHQPNLAAYDGVHSLITDLLDRTIQKYAGYSTVPILSPNIEDLGRRMADRTAAHAATVMATIVPGTGIVVTSNADVNLPITGLHLDGAEFYGGQWITTAALSHTNAVTLPLTTNTVNVQAPVVSAGAAQTVSAGHAASLAATASDPNLPPRKLQYTWIQTSGPVVSLSAADTLTPTFTAPPLVVGNPAVTLAFSLTASNGVLTSTASTSVKVDPPVGAPTVVAGAAQTVPSGSAVGISATASDPNVPARSLTYSWRQTSGTAVTLTGADTLTPHFTAPTLPADSAPAALGFTLTVDNGAASSTASTTVNVEQMPTVTPGAQQTVDAKAPVTLAATASDHNIPQRTLQIAWTQTGGPAVTLSGANTLAPAFTAPTLAVGDTSKTLGFHVAVTNGTFGAAGDTSVIVRPPVGAPVITGATAPATAQSGSLVTLGVTAADPNNPARPLTYAWTQTSGPAVTMAGANTTAPTFTPTLKVGDPATPFAFSVTVSNGTLSATRTTTTSVIPPVGAPTISATTAPPTAQSGTLVTLGVTATDPNNPARPLTYAWSQTSGPTVTLSAANTAAPTFTPTLKVGDPATAFAFSVTVSNGTLSTTGAATTTVSPPVGPPTINATTAPATAQSGSLVTLGVTATDPNNPARPLTYAWSQTGGPAVTITGANTAAPAFTPALNVGDPATPFAFNVTVSNGTLSSTGSATTTVSPPIGAPTITATTAPATAQAGSIVNLGVTATDPNNPARPLTYAWSQTAGPAVTLTGGGTSTPSFIAPALKVGDPATPFAFSVTVSNGSLSATGTANTSVTPPVGAPTISATSAPATIQSGSLVTLGVTATDPNNPPRSLTYAWTQTSGPAVTLTGATTAAPTFTPALNVGDPSTPFAFSVTVSNGTRSSTGTTSTSVTPPIGAPSITATTAPATADSGTPVTLGVTATDPNNPARPLTYVWSQTSGPAVTLTGATTAAPTFTPTLKVGDVATAFAFSVTVSNGSLSATRATPSTTVNPPVGAPAISATTAPATADSGSPVTLGVTATDPNNPARPLTYAWSQTSGPAVTLTGGTTAAPSFTPTLKVGDPATPFAFTVTVGNGISSSTGSATTTVNPPVGAPTITATSAPASVDSGSLATLGVTAKDPNNPARTLTYAWTQTAGPAVTLAGATTASPSFTAPTLAVGDPPATLAFSVTVSNGTLSVPGSATTTVNPVVGAPTITGTAAPASSASGALVQLGVTAVDPNDPPQPLTYAWTQTSGPAVTLTGANTSAPTFTPTLNVGDPATPYAFKVTVSNATLSSTAVTTTTISPPVGAPAITSTTAPVTSESGVPVTLGVAATDPNNPARPLTYAWTQSGGPAVTLTGANTASPTFTPVLNVGDPATPFTFSVTVSNGTSTATGSASTSVNPPVGAPSVTGTAAPVTADSGTLVTLGVTATDPNNPPRPLAYAWSQTSGPAVTLNGANTAAPTYTPTLHVGDGATAFAFSVTVSNGTRTSTGSATTTVTAPVGAPTINATTAPATAEGGSLVTLSVAATDSNSPARPLTYAWRQTSGPVVALTGADTSSPRFTAPTLNVGDPATPLGFSVAVGNGTLTSTATATTTVNAPIGAPAITAISAPPSAESGTLVTLGVTAADPNSPVRPLTYAWTQTGGPAVTLTGADTAAPTFTPILKVGDPATTYAFSVSVANGTLSATGTATTTVNPPVGAPAIAATTAPAAVDAAAPVTLGVTATDPNNPPRVLTYAWAQTSGPAVTLAGANTASPSFTAPALNVGDLAATVGFTVTVGNGTASSTASTVTAVNPPVGAPVIASVTAPPNAPSGAMITLTGGASDPNRPARPLTYTWQQASGPAVALNGANMPTATFMAPVLNPGDPSVPLSFTLKADNGMLSTTSAPITVNVDSPPPPTIGALTGSGSGTSATVTWTTNVPATSAIQYGVSPDALTMSASNPSFVTAHSIGLTGLSTNTTYYYRVMSSDSGAQTTTAPTIDTAPAALFVSVPSGLVAAYGFEEGTGTVLGDASGAGNAGTISGGTWTAGRYGNALSFDGASNWITVNPAASLDLTTGMTLEAWVKPTSSSGWEALLYKERPASGGTDAGLAWALYSSDDTAPPAIYRATAGSYWDHVTGTSMLPLNNWSHVVGTYDGSVLRLYVNGTLVRSANYSGPMPVTAGPLRIGGNGISPSGQYFSGAIDEIRIYNRALSQAEIQADMTRPITPSVASVTPANGSTGAAVTSAVTVKFSGPMDPATISAATLELMDATTSAPIATTVAYNTSTTTATITPSAVMNYSRGYTVLVHGGPSGVLDPLGTPLSADVSAGFTTSDPIPPVISAVAATVSGTSATITWTTNVKGTSTVQYGVSAAALTSTSDNATLVTAHSVVLSGLSANTTYYYRVTSADAAGLPATSPSADTPPLSFFVANANGLVAAYSFNEGAGTVLGDTSGAGNAGAISGATWTTGKYGGALSFDGASNLVTINDSPALDLTKGMTLEAWVKPASITGWQTIMYKERPGTSAGLAWALYSSDNTAPPSVYRATTTSFWDHVMATSTLPLNTWTHVVGTYDGSTLRIYVNGNLMRSANFSGAMAVTAGPLRIGGNGISPSGQYFKGAIDEIRIYNRALSQAEIRTDMNTAIH